MEWSSFQLDSNQTCVLDLKKCFSGESGPTSSFISFTFINPSCGDWFILHLLSTSGPLRFSSFHPLPEFSFPKIITEVQKNEMVPHLPLKNNFKTAKFELESVARYTGHSEEENIRVFCMKLTQRYSYSIRKTSRAFEMLTNQYSTARILSELEEKTKGEISCEFKKASAKSHGKRF